MLHSQIHIAERISASIIHCAAGHKSHWHNQTVPRKAFARSDRRNACIPVQSSYHTADILGNRPRWVVGVFPSPAKVSCIALPERRKNYAAWLFSLSKASRNSSRKPNGSAQIYIRNSAKVSALQHVFP